MFDHGSACLRWGRAGGRRAVLVFLVPYYFSWTRHSNCISHKAPTHSGVREGVFAALPHTHWRPSEVRELYLVAAGCAVMHDVHVDTSCFCVKMHSNVCHSHVPLFFSYTRKKGVVARLKKGLLTGRLLFQNPGWAVKIWVWHSITYSLSCTTTADETFYDGNPASEDSGGVVWCLCKRQKLRLKCAPPGRPITANCRILKPVLVN